MQYEECNWGCISEQIGWSSKVYWIKANTANTQWDNFLLTTVRSEFNLHRHIEARPREAHGESIPKKRKKEKILAEGSLSPDFYCDINALMTAEEQEARIQLLEDQFIVDKEALDDANDRLFELESQPLHRSEKLRVSTEEGKKVSERVRKADQEASQLLT
ncbi:hypothetical protein HAX54_029897 [Datura stramonium]|uniref:Uncharacterized protein n=1 Tax=Datura stramonium TaxID=4076 RepID=A0ABS8V9H9_DATST|nr:hypothetical protein [Datura stramonium]